MKSAVALVILACLVTVHVQGRAMGNVRRCLCHGPGVKMVRPENIATVEVYPPSPYCEKVEIIVILKKNAGQMCVNTASRFGQHYIKTANQKRSAQ